MCLQCKFLVARTGHNRYTLRSGRTLALISDRGIILSASRELSLVSSFAMGQFLSKEQILDRNGSPGVYVFRQTRRRMLSPLVVATVWIITILLLHVVVASPATAQERCPLELVDEYNVQLDQNISLLVGTSFYSFTCRGTKTATFELNGVAVTESNADSRMLLTGNNLALTDLRTEDTGCYQCRGLAAGKLCESQNVCLTVLRGYPRVNVETTEFFVRKGSTQPLTLKANVTNLVDCGPDLVVSWTVNDKLLRNGTKGVVYRRRDSWLLLTLSNVSYENVTVQLDVGNSIQYANQIEFSIIVFDNDISAEEVSTNKVRLSPTSAEEITHVQQPDTAVLTSNVFLDLPTLGNVMGIPPSNETGTRSYVISLVLSMSVGVPILVLVFVMVIVILCRHRTRQANEAKRTTHTDRSSEDVHQGSDRINVQGTEV